VFGWRRDADEQACRAPSAVDVELGQATVGESPPGAEGQASSSGRAAGRGLAAPAAALLAVCLVARSGTAEHITGVAGTAMVLFHRLTPGLAAFRLRTLVAHVARTAALPTPWR
jgi:hypothetical protein